MDCLFCKIIKRKVSADICHEDDKFIAFRDIKPLAPVHILVIPKKHIPSIDHLEQKDKELMGELFLVAQKIARDESIAKTGYRLAFNVGRGAGQIIDHLHLHLLGNWKKK